MPALSEKHLADTVKELSTAGAPPALFCKSWPTVKQVLKMLANASSPWVKLAVSIVLQLGNALAKKCPK